MALILPPNQCYIFFPDPQAAYTPAIMKQHLRDRGMTVTGRKEPFRVQWVRKGKKTPELFVSLHRGEFVETIIRGLVGQRRKHRQLIPGCDTYVLIEFADLEEVLDEINTLIEVQTAIQEGTRGLMYMSWNHNFAGPED